MKRALHGFTLVEIMVILAIIGILATLSVPASQRAMKRARAGRFLNDLRVLNGAFEQYRFEHQDWPPEADSREVPAGMGPYLGSFPFADDTPIGGAWDWDNDAHDITAGISVVGPAFTPTEMAEMVDAKIDDGNLSSGGFQQTAGAIFTNILEQ